MDDSENKITDFITNNVVSSFKDGYKIREKVPIDIKDDKGAPISTLDQLT
jgi:hypothetical protein